jgi:hypothetical protein
MTPAAAAMPTPEAELRRQADLSMGRSGAERGLQRSVEPIPSLPINPVLENLKNQHVRSIKGLWVQDGPALERASPIPSIARWNTLKVN